jgi:hypothetical protein
MRTLGLIRAGTPAPSHDLWPRLRARLRAADERVLLELPELTWRWRLVAAAAIALPVFLPEPLRFLTASGLL